MTMWEQVAEEEGQEKAGQTRRRWTTQGKMATEGRTLVEVQLMVVVTLVAEA